MPVTPAQIDAAVPPAGTPDRTLTNAALKGLITDIAAVGVGIGVGTVNTFADLPAPATVTGERWWVLTSTGVWLVNRKTKGAYYSDGAAWSYLGDFPVTAVEVGFTPAGSIAASDVQAAIEEVNTERAPGGVTNSIQYNNSGVLGGASKLAVGASGNLVLAANTSQPTAPPADTLGFYARSRATALWPEVQRANGREIPLQPHWGLNRVGVWAPGSGTGMLTPSMPRTGQGTVSHPGIAATNLSTSIRRWRMTSAATANSVSDERNAVNMVWRGNAAGLGGFTYVSRFCLVTTQVSSVAFFGLAASTAAFSTTQTIGSLVNVIGIGFNAATMSNWHLIHNDGAGSPTQIDLGASFPVSSTTNVYTLVIYSAVNGSDIGVRITEEVSGTVQEYVLTTDIPDSVTFLNVRNYLNNGGVAAAVAYDCNGVYLESDY